MASIESVKIDEHSLNDPEDDSLKQEELTDVFSKDGITSTQVTLLGLNLGLQLQYLDQLIKDDQKNDPVVQAVAVFDAWKKSGHLKRGNDREVFVAALIKSGMIRTSRSLSKTERRRASTIEGLRQEDVWPQLQNLTAPRAEKFVKSLNNSFDESAFEKELRNYGNHPGLAAYSLFADWKKKLSSSGLHKLRLFQESLRKAEELDTKMSDNDRRRAVDQVTVTEPPPRRNSPPRKQPFCYVGSTVAVISIAVLLAICSIVCLIIIMVLSSSTHEDTNIYPILKEDAINLPIPMSEPPSYVDIKLIGHVSSTCRMSIAITNDIQYTDQKVFVNSGSFDNVYLAVGSSVTIDPDDVLIYGTLDIWLFLDYVDLFDAIEDGFGYIKENLHEHECSENALCGSISRISQNPLQLTIDESSYYSLRCLDEYPSYNCSALRKLMVSKVSYTFNNSVISYDIRVNDEVMRIQLDSQKSPFVLALLNDSCDASHQHFIVTAYPTPSGDVIISYYITMGLQFAIMVLCVTSTMLLCIYMYHHYKNEQTTN